MSLLSRRRGSNGLEIWPGYVDALSTLLMVTIFVLLVFVLAEAFLSVALSGSDKTIASLRGQIAQLSSVLSMEKTKDVSLEGELAELKANLQQAEAERARLTASLAASQSEVSGQEKLNEAALSQVQTLNEQIAALRMQLASLAVALDAARRKDKAEHVQIVNLGQRLNEALARQVQHLQLYRSEFFGDLRKVLAGKKNIRIVGDRFVFESDVLFPTDSAQLSSQGQQKIADVANAIIDIAKKIPPHLNWIISVDGFADQNAIQGGPYKNNFDLSAARALAVLHFLIQDGVPKKRVVAAAFGAEHPIKKGNSPEALAQNRRIEFRLTSAD